MNAPGRRFPVSTATTTARAYEHVFPGEPEQVAHARHDVARYLDGHPLTDDAVLIVSELATNAIRHSGSYGQSFTVRAELFAGYLWLEVEDLAGREWERKPGDGTHGLDMVTALSGEWDVEETGDGTRVVWARLETR